MLRILSRTTLRYFSSFRFPAPEFDTANMVGLCNIQQPLMKLSQKLTFYQHLYSDVDIFSRELLFTLAYDYSLGVGTSIVIVTLLIKGIFLYPTLKGQINALKMQQLKPHMDRFKQKIKIAQQTRNPGLMKTAQSEFKIIRKKHGIDNIFIIYNLLQIPFLITWFFSLRYVTNLPQVFTSLQSDGFLWFTDLSAIDGYFLLPIIAAMLSSVTIAYSPNLGAAVSANSPFLGLIKYVKFLPFLAIPFTAWFPSALNLYWLTLAASQGVIVLTLNSSYVQRKYGLLTKKSAGKVVKAVFIQQKSGRLVSEKQTENLISLRKKQNDKKK